MGSLSLLQGIFPTQGSNPGLPHCRQILYQLSHKGSPITLKATIFSLDNISWTFPGGKKQLYFFSDLLNRYLIFLASLVAQTVKHLPTMWETQVRSLGWKDPLEKEMATHSSILAWKIPWTEEPGSLQSMGLQRVGHN